MAKSGLKEWLSDDNKAQLANIVRESRTDKEIYETMGIRKDTFYSYMKNSDFSDLIKKIKGERRQANLDRLVKLHDAMWEKAVGYVVRETVKEIKGENGKRVTETTKEFSHDSTLMIYLDKTYGTNINADEIRARTELSKIRAEEVRVSLEAEEIEDMDEIRAEVYGEDDKNEGTENTV